MVDLAQSQVPPGHDGGTRRDFLILTAGALAGIGAACAIWPFVDSLNPARDTLALSTTEVDLSPVQVGQRLTVAWRGKPIFVRHRTEKEIKEAESVEVNSLRDPQADSARVKEGHSQWLIVYGCANELDRLLRRFTVGWREQRTNILGYTSVPFARCTAVRHASARRWRDPASSRTHCSVSVLI